MHDRTIDLNGIVTTLTVSIEHPVHLLRRHPSFQRNEYIVEAALRLDPVGEAAKVLPVDDVEHLDDSQPNIPALQCGDAGGRSRP
jgi:hypothetical protein